MHVGSRQCRTIAYGILLALLSGTSCVGPDIAYPETVMFEVDEAALGPYRIHAGDALRVVFPYYGERNMSVIVRPDGRFSIPLADEVVAGGQTVSEVAEAVETKVRSELLDAEVMISVQRFITQRVYVGGEVKLPGEIDLTPGMTLHQALLAVGWFTPAAAEDSVVLVRILGPGRRQAFKIDCSEAALLAHDLELSAFDTIYVPKTGIRRIAVWVRQHLERAVPFMLQAYGASMLIRETR